MEETNGGNLFELFCGMIEAFDPCMDDYLYVLMCVMISTIFRRKQ